MAATAPQTTLRSRGHGPFRQAQGGPALHPRAGRVHRRRQPAGPALARHRPQPVRPRADQVDRRVRGPQGPGRRRRGHRQGPRGLQAPLDADPGRRHADGAPGGHRHVPVAGGRRGHRDVPLRRGGRRRRRHGRLRAAAGRRRPVQGARAGRVRPPPGPRPGQGEQPHLALGIGRPGRDRRGDGRGRGPRLRGHLHPADPRRVDRDVRLRRRLEPRPPAAHAPHDDPGAPRDPDGRRARRRGRRPADLGAEHPGQDPRHRRRVRRQGAGLSGLRPGGRRLVPHRQARQVDRGPLREPAGRLVRPRLPDPRRARGHEGRARSPRSRSRRSPTTATPTRRPTRRSSRPACST